jgi:hypothetical protein
MAEKGIEMAASAPPLRPPKNRKSAKPKPHGDIVILGPAPRLTSSICGYPNFLLKKSIKR